MRSLLLLLAAPALLAAQPMQELQTDKIDYFLNAAFARYGHDFNRTIGMGRTGVRFRLDNAPKDATQAGIYSHFTLVGDFECAADYTVSSLPAVKTGYGVSLGIAAHTLGSAGAVFVSRSSHAEWGSCVIVTRELPSKSGKTYESEPFPTGDQAGRLILRRQGPVVIAEVADSGGTVRELKRFDKFGTDPISQLRFYADTGGVSGLVDGWFTEITVKADSINGAAITPDTRWEWTTWLLLGSALLAAVAVGVLICRKRRKRHENA
jgi:hypothetical protein